LGLTEENINGRRQKVEDKRCRARRSESSRADMSLLRQKGGSCNDDVRRWKEDNGSQVLRYGYSIVGEQM